MVTSLSLSLRLKRRFKPWGEMMSIDELTENGEDRFEEELDDEELDASDDEEDVVAGAEFIV